MTSDVQYAALEVVDMCVEHDIGSKRLFQKPLREITAGLVDQAFVIPTPAEDTQSKSSAAKLSKKSKSKSKPKLRSRSRDQDSKKEKEKEKMEEAVEKKSAKLDQEPS